MARAGDALVPHAGADRGGNRFHVLQTGARPSARDNRLAIGGRAAVAGTGMDLLAAIERRTRNGERASSALTILTTSKSIGPTNYEGDAPLKILRTPDARFANLPEFAFDPHYCEITDADGARLRIHYLDQGRRERRASAADAWRALVVISLSQDCREACRA